MGLAYILLGLLASEPSTGYDIKKYFDQFGRFLRSHTQMSQIYRTLSKMEADEWVSSELAEEPNPRKARVYSITDRGYTIFIDWLSSPYNPPSRFKDPQFEVRISFGAFLKPEQLLEIIDTELETRRLQVKKYRHRDRAQDFSRCPDPQLARELADWSHSMSSDAMDRHIEKVQELRDLVVAHMRDSGK
jgi:DNA-binding PadR family transcriptional regulator